MGLQLVIGSHTWGFSIGLETGKGSDRGKGIDAGKCTTGEGSLADKGDTREGFIGEGFIRGYWFFGSSGWVLGASWSSPRGFM
jgi:hypothetical protein